MGLKGKRKSTGPRPAWRHKQEREVSDNPVIHYKHSTYPGWTEAFHRKLCIWESLHLFLHSFGCCFLIIGSGWVEIFSKVELHAVLSRLKHCKSSPAENAGSTFYCGYWNKAKPTALFRPGSPPVGHYWLLFPEKIYMRKLYSNLNKHFKIHRIWEAHGLYNRNATAMLDLRANVWKDSLLLLHSNNYGLAVHMFCLHYLFWVSLTFICINFSYTKLGKFTSRKSFTSKQWGSFK